MLINGKEYVKKYKSSLNSPGGIAIRHQPDGELLAYLKVNTFDKEDLFYLLSVLGTENFSVESIFSSQTHSCYVESIPIVTTEHPKAKNQIV